MNHRFSIGIKVLCMALAMLAIEVHAQELYTIDRILEHAYENSPNIRNYKLQLVRSRESLNAQKAALKSRFALDVSPFSYSKERKYSEDFKQWRTYESLGSSGTFSISQPILATDGTVSLSNEFGFKRNPLSIPDEQNSFINNIKLRFDQPIFTYNRTKMITRELELDLENSLLNYALQKLNVERMVSQYYYQVYQKQQSLTISKEEMANQEKSHEIIKNKVDAGLSAREELWQAELNLANARSSVFNAQVALENAKDQLRQAVGLDLDAPISILANTEVKTVTVDQKDAIDYALKQRLELRQQQISIENSQFDLIRASADNEFKGNVSVAVGLFGDNKSVGNIYEKTTDNENVSLSLEIPLWDWGQRKSKIKAAEATLQISELDFENEKIDIVFNIRQTYRNLQNLVYQIEIAEKSVENAQLTYQLNLEKYENGDLTSMDLSLYQNQLSSKKNELTNALINYKLELLNLKIQTLWDFETGKSIVPPLYSSEFNN